MSLSREVDLIVPGPLDLLTGGYVYDRRIFEELADAGWKTSVHAVDPSFPEPDPSALQAACRILDGIPDGRLVVVDGLALSGLVPVLADAVKRLRIVALIHHPLALETGLDDGAQSRLRALETRALGMVGPVIVTSPWTRRILADFEVAAGRVSVVLPGVDRPALDPARAGAPDPGKTVRLLKVATVTPRKGHAVLIDALGTLQDLDWTLRCAGSLTLDPATSADLRESIRHKGLEQRVALLGELEPAVVATEYPQADVFVLASHLEGYGMVVAEAIAYGLPVIATNSGAVAETLSAGAGVLVPPADPIALADAIRSLIIDREKLASLAAGARSAAASIPTWKESAHQFGNALAAAAY